MGKPALVFQFHMFWLETHGFICRWLAQSDVYCLVSMPVVHDNLLTVYVLPFSKQHFDKVEEDTCVAYTHKVDYTWANQNKPTQPHFTLTLYTFFFVRVTANCSGSRGSKIEA